MAGTYPPLVGPSARKRDIVSTRGRISSISNYQLSGFSSLTWPSPELGHSFPLSPIVYRRGNTAGCGSLFCTSACMHKTNLAVALASYVVWGSCETQLPMHTLHVNYVSGEFDNRQARVRRALRDLHFCKIQCPVNTQDVTWVERTLRRMLSAGWSQKPSLGAAGHSQTKPDLCAR